METSDLTVGGSIGQTMPTSHLMPGAMDLARIPTLSREAKKILFCYNYIKTMENSAALFDQYFPKISQEQYEKAAALAAQIRKLIAQRGECLARGGSTQLIEPNYAWDPIQLISYCFDPTYDIVNTWRLHTYMFSGNSLLPYIGAYFNVLPKRLLKTYKEKTDGLPNKYINRPPKILGECGWEIDGGIVNDDTLMYQTHISTLYFEGVLNHLASLSHAPKILEIGGGYGAVAYKLKELLPNARYYIIDLVESLFFSAIYLQIASPQSVSDQSVYNGENKELLDSKGSAFTFIPNYLARELIGSVEFDLVINTGSFGEMKRNQVAEYADIINKTLAKGGLLYEQNHDTVYDDLAAYMQNGVNVLIPLKDILSKQFLHCYSIDGRKKFWFLDTSALDGIASHKKKIIAHNTNAWLKRSINQQAKKVIQRFPRIKAMIKAVVR